MGEAGEFDEACRETFLVVRYLDGRPAVIDDGDDICPVYEGDTVPTAAKWLFAERGFERCLKAEAVAEIVVVTITNPKDPAHLEAALQVAAREATVTYGFVRVSKLYAEAG